MFKFVKSVKIYPKNQENKMALKKEGILIPIVQINCNNLSVKFCLLRAEIIPKKIPKNVAIIIDAIAKTNVLGKVSFIISKTGLPDF